MVLRKYQQRTVDVLKEYLKELEVFEGNPKRAFISVIENEERSHYNSDFFGEVPFICIKIPTGGGKTLVGCQSVAEIMNSVLKNKMDRGIIMWFVPSEAIKTQTLKKLNDKKDIHRKLLDEEFDNNIKIFANEDALRIKKSDIEDNICIIVSSLDAFRKEKSLQNKYKVYQENGALLEHFDNLQNVNEDKLEKDESGVLKSLANVIRLNSPLIVIDEGHKTKTQLSIDFLKELNPSFIIEYTATPRTGSNILVEIHSTDLKEEEMVKLPIVLTSCTQWQNAVIEGTNKVQELEKICRKNKENIRPIALLQAEQEKESDKKITVQQIKDFLIKEKGINQEEIAIKTSSKNELQGVDLFDKKCKIRYIITVNALAEGWDCSFAYILISVANIGSKVAVEQIIGRIMRMPYAKRRNVEDLNRSYIFASARNFNESAEQIISGLEANGYSRLDLINATEKSAKDESESVRNIKEDFGVPQVCLDNELLTFEDLIGSDFELSKQDYKINFKVHYDNDGRALIDVKEGDKWFRERQTILNLNYNDKNCSDKELILWLDKKLRFTMIEKEDKMKFLKKVIEYLIKEKKFNVSNLSVNRYILKDEIEKKIDLLLEDYSKERFNSFSKKGNLGLKVIEGYPEKIMISDEIPQKFNKNYYEKIEKLNKEELTLVQRLDLDSLPNIKFWVRNREKKDFFIQGWKPNKFYPDFIAVTNEGDIIVIEWKGADRVSNEDTEYKVEIAKIWEKLGKDKLHFFLAHTGNIEEVLTKIKVL